MKCTFAICLLVMFLNVCAADNDEKESLELHEQVVAAANQDQIVFTPSNNKNAQLDDHDISASHQNLGDGLFTR